MIYPRKGKGGGVRVTRRERAEGKSRGTERGASLGMPFRVSRQVAISSKRRPSEPARVKRNHTDLHIMIYILVLCLSSTLSPLVSHRPLRPYRKQPPPSSPASLARSFSLSSPFVSSTSRPNTPFPPHVYPICPKKCRFTDVSDSPGFPFPPSLSFSRRRYSHNHLAGLKM